MESECPSKSKEAQPLFPNLELPPWIYLPCDDYDMGVVKAQWWAEKEYGEGIASR